MNHKEKLESYITEIESLADLNSGAPAFNVRKAKVGRLLSRTFGDTSNEAVGFEDIRYFSTGFTMVFPESVADQVRREKETIRRYKQGLKEAKLYLESLIDEVPERSDSKKKSQNLALDSLFEKFHTIANIFARGHEGSGTFEIKKEKDVQLILLGLLQLYFDDVRPEEAVKSHSTSNSKVDFYIPKEKLFIEVKYNLDNVKFRKDVHDDINIYKADEKCEKIIFFLYDPHYKIKGAISTENDFHQDDSFPVKVFIRPQ